MMLWRISVVSVVFVVVASIATLQGCGNGITSGAVVGFDLSGATALALRPYDSSYAAMEPWLLRMLIPSVIAGSDNSALFKLTSDGQFALAANKGVRIKEVRTLPGGKALIVVRRGEKAKIFSLFLNDKSSGETREIETVSGDYRQAHMVGVNSQGDIIFQNGSVIRASSLSRERFTSNLDAGFETMFVSGRFAVANQSGATIKLIDTVTLEEKDITSLGGNPSSLAAISSTRVVVDNGSFSWKVYDFSSGSTIATLPSGVIYYREAVSTGSTVIVIAPSCSSGGGFGTTYRLCEIAADGTVTQIGSDTFTISDTTATASGDEQILPPRFLVGDANNWAIREDTGLAVVRRSSPTKVMFGSGSPAAAAIGSGVIYYVGSSGSAKIDLTGMTETAIAGSGDVTSLQVMQ